MQQCSHLNCYNDLDKVYGVLGLFSMVCDFPIDYRRTTEEVYIDFATSCISKEGAEDVFISSTCGKKRSNTLPSWVPDWRGIFVPYTELFSRTAELHSACPVAFRGLSSERYLKVEGGRVKISALVVDTLNTCVPTFSDIVKSEASADRKELGSLQLKTFRQWQGLLPSFQENLLQVVCCGVWTNQGSGFRKLVPADSEEIEQFWTTIGDAGIKEQDVPRDTGPTIVERRVVGAHLFLTTSGRLGNASERVEASDSVALFPGCRIPFIIRPVEDMAEPRKFRLISPCYVHGIMHREALEEAIKAKTKIQELEACLHEFETIHARPRAQTRDGDLKALTGEVTEKYFRNLFEDIVLV